MRHALRARYVFPVASAPIADGVVTIENGRIVGVGGKPADTGCPVTDLGNVAVLPGLVNAHTHLEFSGLTAPLGAPGMLLPDWIRLVVGHRRGLPLAMDWQKGRRECEAGGSVAIGEIATTNWFPSSNSTIFLEIIGLKRELSAGRLATARQHLAKATPRFSRRGIRLGVSPHAPYSVHPELFDALIDVANESHAPVAFHLAETLEELDLLATGGGPFRQLLIELGAWDETAIPRGTRPIHYLRRLADRGGRALVIHGNYLNDEEIDLLAAHADRLAVVYCPRTHAYFGHARHPLPKLLAAGANVALGTDSRASNPDLNLLEEVRHVARSFAELPASTALELGTLRAARALGIDDRLGSLEPGKLAAFAIVALPGPDTADPYQLLYQSGHPAKPLRS